MRAAQPKVSILCLVKYIAHLVIQPHVGSPVMGLYKKSKLQAAGNMNATQLQ